mgnify:FL=1
MIYLNNVTKKYYGDEPSLVDVNHTKSSGEFVLVIVHSGAVKTTLAKLILAEEKPTSGTVFFESLDIHRLSSRELTQFRRKVGVVFQDFRLLQNRTAYENIAFAMEAIGKTDEEIADLVPHVLALVNLSDRSSYFPHQLSGGEKQRLAIARAIITEPELIIADEPTGNLDPTNAKDVIEILKKINDLGTTVILTTHNPSIIASLKKRVITFEKGKVIRDEVESKYMI